MAKTERRTNKRIPARFKINFIHEGDYIISFSKDISADGMFIYTNSPPPVGSATKLTFSIGRLENVSVDAKVVWVNAGGNISDCGMGLQFLWPPKSLKDAIIKIVNKVAVLQDKGVV